MVYSFFFDVFDASNGFLIGACSVSGWESAEHIFHPDPADWLDLLDSYIGQNVVIKPSAKNPQGLICDGLDNKTGLVLAENDGAKDYALPSVLELYLDRMEDD